MIHHFIYAVLSVCILLLSANWAHAVNANDELAYRVRFSGPADVVLLIKKGADPDAVNTNGLPMVSVAAMRTDDDAVPVLKALIENGANVNKGGVNNQYPIIIAARENNTTMMEFLVFQAEADYTVRDLNGMLPLEIAEYYGNSEAADMIRDLTQQQIDQERWLRSDERRFKLMKELGDRFCEFQYKAIYYKTGQDKHSKEFMEEENARNNEELLERMQELHKYFNLAYEYINVLKEQIGAPLKQEFSAMISNRERKRRGVGTDKDLQERCGRIAGTWYDDYMAQQ